MYIDFVDEAVPLRGRYLSSILHAFFPLCTAILVSGRETARCRCSRGTRLTRPSSSIGNELSNLLSDTAHFHFGLHSRSRTTARALTNSLTDLSSAPIPFYSDNLFRQVFSYRPSDWLAVVAVCRDGFCAVP